MTPLSPFFPLAASQRRRGRERSNPSRTDLVTLTTENSNNNNVKSNNHLKNSKIDSDNVKINVVNHYHIPGLADAGKPKLLDSILKDSTFSMDLPKDAQGNDSSALASNAISTTLPKVCFELDRTFRTHSFNHSESLSQSTISPSIRSVSGLSDDASVATCSGGGYPLPKQITSEQLKRHIPKETEKYVRVYMSAVLFGSKRTIPLWSPSPGIETNPQEFKDHIDIGDVGFFNDEGGFDTLFNIFLTAEQNHDRHYAPPDNFVPYDQPFKIGLQDVALPPSKMIKAVGIENLPDTDHSLLIGLAHRINATRCSALYLRSGYRSASIKSHHRPEILAYIQHQQGSWQLHVERKYSGQLQDRPLLVIFSSLRTKTCALAAGAKPNILKSWKPKITLQKLIEGDHVSHIWESNDNNIETKFAPSLLFREKLETYVDTMGANLSAESRKELEESHCVAVGAYSVQDKGWRGNPSFVSTQSARSFRSKLPILNRFESRVRENGIDQ